MFKKSLFLTMLSIFAMTANAQQLKLGVTAGMNINCPSGENGQSSHAGFDAGVKAEIGLPSVAKGLYADFGVQLSLKGTKSCGNYYNYPNRMQERSEQGGSSSAAAKYELSYNTYYLTVPLHVGYKFELNNIRMFVNAGPYMGIGLFGKLNGTASPSGTETTLSDNVYSDKLANRFDWGVGGRIGVEFARHYQVAVGYDHGLKSLKTDKNPVDRKNRTFNISLAYIF